MGTTAQELPWLDGLTIGQVLAETARKHPKREALVFHQSVVRMNYAEFAGAVRDVAKGLLALGIQPGEHVGIWATNLPEWVLLQFAAATIGVVLVTINPAYRPLELRYTLEQSDVAALFLTDEFKSSNYYSIFGEACPEIAQAHHGKISCASFPKLRYAIAIERNGNRCRRSHKEDDSPDLRLPQRCAVQGNGRYERRGQFCLHVVCKIAAGNGDCRAGITMA